MRQWVIGTWVLLIALFGWWQGAESEWESTGVLVLDISRSMQDNDPHNIRGDGEQTFIDLLSSVEGNHLGIVFFGAKARVMKPITPIQRETTKSLKDGLPPVDSRAQRTEIGLGIARGLEVLEGRGGTRYLVVMSDGELDRSGRAAQKWTHDDELALRELRALYPKLRQENIPVFTIALTEASRKALTGGAEPAPHEPVQMTAGEMLLQEIADSTHGKFYRILRQRDYLDAFLDIFLHVRPPTLYTRPRQADAKFFLNRFDSEAIVFGPRDMVIVTPDGSRFGLGLPASAKNTWIRVYPYQHWSLVIVSRPLGNLSTYEGTYQLVDQSGNPVHDHKVLVHSAITLAWEHPPKPTYSSYEVLPIVVKVQSLGMSSLQEDPSLAEFLQGAEIVASVWLPHSPLPMSQRLTPLNRDGQFVFAGAFEETTREGEYRLEVELLSEQHPSLNRKLSAAFTVGSPYFHFAILRHGPKASTRVLESRNGQAQAPVYAGDQVELLAELAGGTVVDFHREPTVRAEVMREGQPWQVLPLDRVREGDTVRYRSRPITVPAAGTYTVTFRAEGSAMAEVWDDRLVSTRSLRVNPVQIVFPGQLQVSPLPWTMGRIVKYVALGGSAIGLAVAAGLAVIAQFVRVPLRGWLLSTGQGTPQLLVLNGNPRGTTWRRLFPKTCVTIGTDSRCDYPLELRDTGVEIDAEVYVGPWWERTGAIYLRSRRQPSHISVDGAEVTGTRGVLLKDEEALEKPIHVRFGNYVMTFDA
ncbi:MAG TPA: VWA domain-containing protein [Alphaproteobacteria bacterium]|nr:VWA domain-containing protein [Alphaproteobacteria bacterium]